MNCIEGKEKTTNEQIRQFVVVRFCLEMRDFGNDGEDDADQ